MTHNHTHHHAHGDVRNYNSFFAIGIGLNILFVIIEVFYGIFSNSSALLADAGHNAGDVFSLIFAWFAIWLSKKKAVGRFTYGYKKTTILISLLNAVLLFGAVVLIGVDAIDKTSHPKEIEGESVMIVAAIGVVINTITALLFFRDQKHDLNIKGAFLHMAADALVSLGVVVSGFIILKTGALWVDTLMTFIIIIVIFISSWKLFTESLSLALDAVPAGLDIEKIKANILELDEVEAMHELHVWALSTNENSLSAHIISKTENKDQLLIKLNALLHENFGINHSTLQIESKNIDCFECD